MPLYWGDDGRPQEEPILESDLPSGIDAAKIGSGSVSNTEFGYLDGVTSGIQTQLDGKITLNAAIAESGWNDSQRQIAAPFGNQWRINATSGGGIYLLVAGFYGILVTNNGTIQNPGWWQINNTFASLPTTYIGSGVLDFNGGLRLWTSNMATRGRMYSGSSETVAGVIASNGNLAARTGAVECLPLAVSLAQGGTREVATTASSRNSIIDVFDTSDKWTEYRCKNGTLSILRQDVDATEYVVGPPGSGQIGLEVSSGTLRLNNNSGSARSIGFFVRGI